MSDQFTGSEDATGTPPTKRAMSDDEIRAVTDREINDSYSWTFGKVATERARAEQYYLGEAVGDMAPPAIPDRSSYVSTDVADTVEWMLPVLVEIFTAGDDVVEFSAVKPGDDDAAKQTADVVNHVFYEMNPGWYVLYTWFKDALIQKNGIVKVWWDDTPDTVREEYRGLTAPQFTMLMQDETVEPVEHSAYTDPLAAQAAQQQYEQAIQQYQQAQYAAMAQGQQFTAPQPQPPQPAQLPQLHDVAVTRTTAAGKVCVENVPPEEFLISRKAKRIGDGACGHRIRRTVSYLRQRGYANVDQITSDTIASVGMNQEAIVRRSKEDAPFQQESDGNGDESMREVWLTEWYTQIDADGDGIAEWRKIVRSGSAILENVECDGPPFSSLCAVPLPHLFFGSSPAEQAMSSQRLKTTIWRGIIDNMQMQINGRTWAVEDQVNIDDLLTNRPGGVVRVKTPQAVGPLQQGMSDFMGAYQLLDVADAAKQDRTGVTKYTQGSDADTLNKTAAGLENITQRSDQRIKLVARIFAETGVKDLFRLIQKLLAQYQDRPMTLKLRGTWVDVDPRAWKNQYNMTANVGLGTGDKTRQVQHLTTLGQAQREAMQIGAATPQNVYNTLKKLPGLLGFQNPDDFFSDPAKAAQPQQPPQPSPEVAAVQADTNVRIQQAQLQDRRERDKLALEMAWEREKFYAELAAEREAIYIKAGLPPAQEASDFAATVHSGLDAMNGAMNGTVGVGSSGFGPAFGAGPGAAGAGNPAAPAGSGSPADAAAGIATGLGQQPGPGY